MIEKKIQQAQSNTTEVAKQDDSDLNAKYTQVKKELNDLKVNFQIKCRENDALVKEIAELKDAAKQNLYGSKDSVESKKMLEEI